MTNPSKHRLWPIFLIMMGLLFLPQASASDEGGGPAGTVKLEWDLSWESDVAGYRVHYGSESRNYTETIDVGYRITTELTDLAVGETLYFAVTVYNTYGVESVYSNEVSTTVLAPPEVLDTDDDLLSDLFEETWGEGIDLEPFADLDGDGLTALEEFAHGMNPIKADERPRSEIETVLVDDALYLCVRYLADPNSYRHVTIHLERSLNLADPDSWERGQTVTVSTTISEEFPTLLEIVARSVSPIASQQQEYLRFHYEATEP